MAFFTQKMYTETVFRDADIPASHLEKVVFTIVCLKAVIGRSPRLRNVALNAVNFLSVT